MIISPEQILIFFLIFARFFGLLLMAPIFNRKELFSSVKVTLLFWISGLFLMIVPLPQDLAFNSPFAYVLAFLMDFLIGVLIGFTMDLIVSAVELGGNIMDTQAGLSVAALLNPGTGRQETILAILLKRVTLLFFLLVEGHHFVLSTVVQSFEVLPIGGVPDISSGALFLAEMGSFIFLVAIKLAAPIILVVFMVDFGMGVLNKLAEQINVFQLGFQVKPMVSLIIFLAMTPILMEVLMEILVHSTEEVVKLLVTLKGG